MIGSIISGCRRLTPEDDLNVEIQDSSVQECFTDELMISLAFKPNFIF